MNRYYSVLIIAVTICLGVVYNVYPSSKSPFEVMTSDESQVVHAGSKFSVDVVVRSPEGHYLYADETSLEFVALEGAIIKDISYPKGEMHYDQYLNKEVRVYLGDTHIVITGEVPVTLVGGEKELMATLRFRGCSPNLCFRPEERDILIRLNVLSLNSTTERTRHPVIDSYSPKKTEKSKGLFGLLSATDFAKVLDSGIFITVLIVFLAGILTSFTPCVWPIIPLILMFVGIHPHKRLIHNLLLAVSLVMGLVVVYAALGTVAVLAGKNLGFLFQHRIFIILVVAFFITMSLSMFGLFELKLPHALTAHLSQAGGRGYRGAFVAGMCVGIMASPCAGPVVAALLAYVAMQKNYIIGFAMLAVYGLGMGIVLIAIGTFYGELAGRLKSGRWMKWIKVGLGILLLVPALFYASSLFERSPSNIEGIWVYDEAAALNEAYLQNKPIMMEFGANWCPPCLELKYDYFDRKEIVEIARNLVAVYVDATKETPAVRAIINRYNVTAWPTIIFLAPDGSEYNDLRVEGTFEKDRIERGMRESLERSKKPAEQKPSNP